MNMIRQAEQEKGNFDTSGNSHVELINCFENLFWWFNHRHRFLPRTVSISWSHFEIKLGEWQQNDVIFCYLVNHSVSVIAWIMLMSNNEWIRSTSITKKRIKIYFIICSEKHPKYILFFCNSKYNPLRSLYIEKKNSLGSQCWTSHHNTNHVKRKMCEYNKSSVVPC